MRTARYRMLIPVAALLLAVMSAGSARADEKTIQHTDLEGHPTGRTELLAGKANEFDAEGHFLGHEERQGDQIVTLDREGHVVARHRASR